VRPLIILAVLLLVTAVHPYVDTGSDSDEALEAGCLALLCGDNPYTQRTHLGNPLTPMLGGILLNLPCVLLGAHVWCLLWIYLCVRDWRFRHYGLAMRPTTV
jgi:hypothetical protein